VVFIIGTAHGLGQTCSRSSSSKERRISTTSVRLRVCKDAEVAGTRGNGGSWTAEPAKFRDVLHLIDLFIVICGASEADRCSYWKSLKSHILIYQTLSNFNIVHGHPHQPFHHQCLAMLANALYQFLSRARQGHANTMGAHAEEGAAHRQVLGQVRHCGHGQLPWGHAKLHPDADVENSVFFFEFFVSQGGHEPYELWHFLMQQPAQTMGITRYYKCLLLFNHNWHKNPHVDIRNGEPSITWMTLCDFSASLKDIIHRKPWVQNMSGKLRKLGDVPIKYECVQCFSSDFPGKKA